MLFDSMKFNKLMIITLLTLSIILSFGCTCVGAARVEGSLVTEDNWVFFDKFCFSNQKWPNSTIGRMEWNVTTTNNRSNLKFVLYLASSGKGSWSAAYDKFKSGNWTCDELVDMRHVSENGAGMYSVSSKGATFNDNVHPYFWFFALADCSSTTGINISHYEVHYTNTHPVDTFSTRWYLEFSFDQQGLAQTYIFFTMLYFALTGAHSFAVFKLWKSEEYHVIVKLVTISVGLLTVSNMFYMIHYSLFALDGKGRSGLEGLALALTMIGQLVFMFMCILVGKGWTISTSHLLQANLIKLMMGLLGVCYLALIIWDYAGRDLASTLYYYDSAIGYITILLRFIFFVWFIWSLFTTLKGETDQTKRSFYQIFGVFTGLWFILLPFFVFISLGVSEWFRLRIITGISLAIDAFGLISMVYLLWPSRIGQYFNVGSSVNTAFLNSVPKDSARYVHDNL